MEDPSENWEIQEHSSSDGSNSKLRWVLHKGLNLGKKIAITGVVISSAPLVLPPLLVISALGFAFSVPFGLVFATYACTEKLMSKLLPGPRSPLMLGNGTQSDGEFEQEDEFRFREGKHWQKGDEIRYQEPEEEVDDEIVKDWGYEEDAGEYLEPMVNSYGHKSTEKDDKEPRNYGDDIVEEDGYVKDVGEDLEGKDKQPLEQRDVRIERIGEEVPVAKRSKWEQPVDVHRVDVVGKSEKNGDVITGTVVDRERDDKVDTCNKEEDLARETTGLLQKVRNEGDVGDPMGKDKGQGKEISDIAKDTDQKNLTLAAEMKKPSEVKSVKLEKLIGKMKGGKKRNKGPKQSKEIRERTTKENVDAIPRVAEQVVEGIKEDNRDEMKAKKVVVVEEPIGDISKPLKGNTFVKAAGGNGAGEKYSNTTDEKPEDYQNISGHTSERSLELTELKHGGIDTVMPASKVPLSEKKIWEHIEALRTIVGYKAAPRATCVEEIKALYVFTGVEPPAASFRNPSDLVEVNDRLQFLMSIVGVK